MVKRDWKARGLLWVAGWLFLAGALNAAGSASLVYAVQTPANGGVIAVNEMGSAYVSGFWLYPQPLPWTPPIGAPARPPYGPDVNSYVPGDTFILGYDPTGQVIYRVFVPGYAFDSARALVATSGMIYFAREERDDDSPASSLVKLRGDAIALPLYSPTLVSGYGVSIRDLAVDSSGMAYVTGQTSDRTYVDYTYPYRTAVYVARVDSAGVIHPIRRLDGTGFDEGIVIDVDEQGFIYVAGTTSSPDFPMTEGTATGKWFVVKLDPSGEIVYSTRLGDEWGDIVEIKARDGGLNVVTAGLSLLHLDASGALVSVTDLGGQGESVVDAVFGPGRTLYVAGSGHPGCPDAFVARVDLAPETWTSECLQGVRIRGLAVGPTGDAYVTGDILAAGLFPAEAIRKSFVARIAFNAPPDCTAAFASPATIWPPNGRLVPISIQGVTDPDGDPVTLTVDAVHQDESLQGIPDATGPGTSGVSLRADRDGKGDGRVYHLSFTAEDGNGGVCTGKVTVCVPHDQGPSRACGDGGALFNSNGGTR